MVASPTDVRPTVRVDAEKTELVVGDGTRLAATWFTPRGVDAERATVVACAMGVRRGYYEPYARFLAQNRCAALTVDYRGIGGSLDCAVGDSRATIADWGRWDLTGAVDAIATRFPDRPLHLVGHSIGGQILPLLGNPRKLSSICTIAAQHGYWVGYPWRKALEYGVFWHVRVPFLLAKHGYFPGKQLGLGEDLPAGVMREWGRFCRSRHYVVDRDGNPPRAGFRAFRAPILAYSVDDDPIAPKPLVQALHAMFTRTTVEQRHVVPRDVGAKAIGHLGFFLAVFKKSLWRDSLEWLRSRGG